jgi:hypothetical protein
VQTAYRVPLARQVTQSLIGPVRSDHGPLAHVPQQHAQGVEYGVHCDRGGRLVGTLMRGGGCHEARPRRQHQYPDRLGEHVAAGVTAAADERWPRGELTKLYPEDWPPPEWSAPQGVMLEDALDDRDDGSSFGRKRRMAS